MFIGENLNSLQVVVLQAVTDRCVGCRFASVENVKKDVDRSEGETPLAEFHAILDQLAAEGLVEREERKGNQYVGLTSDGKRCNRIIVDCL